MRDETKTKKQLISELNELRQYAAGLKSSEAELRQVRESQETFRKVFMQSSIPMAITTLEEGRLMDVSKTFLRLMGLKRDEVVGNTLTGIGFFTEEQRSIFFRELKKKGRVENLELQVGTKGGEFRYGLFNAVMMSLSNEKYLLMVMTDLTERRRAEEALRGSEERLRNIVENATEIIYTLSPDGTLTFVSPAWTHVLGHSVSEVEGRSFVSFVHADDVPACMAFLSKIMSTGKPQRDIEYRVRHKNGQWRWHTSVGSAIKDIQGTPVCYVGIAQDVTERKRVEEDLQKSQEFLMTIFEQSPHPMWISDSQGVLVRINQSCCDLLNISKEDVVGKYCVLQDNIVAEQGLLPLVQNVFLKGEKVRFEIRYDASQLRQLELHNGGSVFLDTSIFPLKDASGKVTNAIVQHIDITARKRTEEALRESEERYRQLFEAESDAIFLIDNETGLILEANGAAEALYGCSREELLSKKNEDLSAEPQDTRRVTRETPLAPHEVVSVPIRFHRKKDGTVFPVEITGRFFTWKERPVHIAAIRDITERKQAEEGRRVLEERLQRAEKMESLGMLAGGVAHDLNNVLGVMMGYSELMFYALDENEPLREHVRNIMKSSERAAAIVQDMLTLTRRGVVTKKPINLNDTITEQLKTPEYMKMISYHSRVRVKTDLEADLLNIKGSPVHMGKALLNLLSNAAEAIRGEGSVTVRTENQYLDRPISGYDQVNAGDYVVLTVSDTGEGISPEDMKRIFDPFYSKKILGRSGTGLGLAVVWGTVKDHDGYLDVRSQPGKGTAFTLYFPVTREEAAEEGHVSPTEYMGKGETILVVDDVKEQRELAARMLTKLNYGVTTAVGGEEAVEYLREHEADLVVLDMIMDPGMDGLETYRGIVGMKPGQKAVIVSGFAETERVKRAQELGAGPFVRKPYILEKIGLAVRRELDRK